jgi:dihydrofolate reductase
MNTEKKSITLVAALAENRCIGVKGRMPWNIPEDYKHFFTLTKGKPCIMGRKTFESILQEIGKPLPGRDNIVITRGGFGHPGAIVCASIEEALERAIGPEICIVGGAQIYGQALPFATVLELTHIHKSYEGDTFFPEFGDDWTEVSRTERPGEPPAIPPFSFVRYERVPSPMGRGLG